MDRRPADPGNHAGQVRLTLEPLRAPWCPGVWGLRLPDEAGRGPRAQRVPRAPHYYCRKRHPAGLCLAPASSGHVAIDGYVEQELIAALEEDGPLAEGLVRQGQAEDARRELEAATFALSQYVTNTTLLDTIGLDSFNEGAQAHQQRVELATMQVEEAQAQLETVEAVTDGDLLRAWKAGELTPLERRAIVANMVDRVVLYRSKTPGKRSNQPIAERVQIVLKGNTLLEPSSQDQDGAIGALPKVAVSPSAPKRATR
jgi:hypothetical protein